MMSKGNEAHVSLPVFCLRNFALVKNITINGIIIRVTVLQGGVGNESIKILHNK
jgi:hypothetical protein